MWILEDKKFPRCESNSDHEERCESVFTLFGKKLDITGPNIENIKDAVIELKVSFQGKETIVYVNKFHWSRSKCYEIYLNYGDHVCNSECISCTFFIVFIHNGSVTVNKVSSTIKKDDIGMVHHPQFTTGTQLMEFIIAFLDALGLCYVKLTDDARVLPDPSSPQHMCSLALIRSFQGKKGSWYSNFGFKPHNHSINCDDLADMINTFPLDELNYQIKLVVPSIAAKHSTLGPYMTELLTTFPSLFNEQMNIFKDKTYYQPYKLFNQFIESNYDWICFF